MKLFRTSIVAVLGFLAASSSGFGQGFYRGGGGFSLRTPGFSLDLEPYGRFRAVAPYGAIDVRGYGFPSPDMFPMPPFPVPMMAPPPGWPGGRFSAMDLDPRVPLDSRDFRRLPPQISEEENRVRPPRFELPSYDDLNEQTPFKGSPSESTIHTLATVESVQRLRLAIEQRDDAEVWIDYMQLDQVAELFRRIDLARATEITAPHRSAAEKLLIPFNAVASTPDLSWLTEIEHFNAVRQTLNEIANPASMSTGEESQVETDPSILQTNPPSPSDPSPETPNVEELPVPQPNPQQGQKPVSVYRGQA